MTEPELLKAVKDAVVAVLNDRHTGRASSDVRAAQVALVLKEKGLLANSYPNCSACNDKGHYKIFSGRGESADVYCEKNCMAAQNLKAFEEFGKS